MCVRVHSHTLDHVRIVKGYIGMCNYAQFLVDVSLRQMTTLEWLPGKIDYMDTSTRIYCMLIYVVGLLVHVTDYY